MLVHQQRPYSLPLCNALKIAKHKRNLPPTCCLPPRYGMPTVRVDGGDARAVYHATSRARAAALQRSGPVLLELMCYR